ncbi:MAG: hypothetical protein FD138_3962 [Planctomycetota bacterium]|nr:MAG: hypothetical protein FD138_3962 [Planctomycetota bacterium]
MSVTLDPPIAQNDSMADEVSSKDWNASVNGEPTPSPIYLCRVGGGRRVLCVRVSFSEGAQWVHGGTVVHGVTHWRKATT